MEKERGITITNVDKQKQCDIHVVRHCTFCGKYVSSTEETLTEDAEIAHVKCLEADIKYWDDRDEAIDLMGY